MAGPDQPTLDGDRDGRGPGYPIAGPHSERSPAPCPRTKRDTPVPVGVSADRPPGDGADVVFGMCRSLRAVERRSDDNGDDNDDNQRHTITAARHRLPTVVEHRAWATHGYGSEGWGFESLRLRPAQRPVPITERASQDPRHHMQRGALGEHERCAGVSKLVRMPVTEGTYCGTPLDAEAKRAFIGIAERVVLLADAGYCVRPRPCPSATTPRSTHSSRMPRSPGPNERRCRRARGYWSRPSDHGGSAGPSTTSSTFDFLRSRPGDMPNALRYSRLNCDGLP
jgi:hypothetical protein